jgi:hypothetical protein
MGAAFRCTVADFDQSTAKEKLGRLISSGAKAGFSSHFHKQTDAWEAEFLVITEMAGELSAESPTFGAWSLLLEYEIPRRQKRPDVILLADDLIFVIEFKVGAEKFSGTDEWQAYSYALDLRDFHAASRGKTIVPVLVATSAPGFHTPAQLGHGGTSGAVLPVQKTNSQQLAGLITEIYGACSCKGAPAINAEEWENAAYRPTPTIIEAAEMLFAGNTVADISHAFATNLTATTDAVVHSVKQSQREGVRTICFITGTPGAGKTLAGLNAVHNPELRREGRPAGIFLSGNGPLVAIIREALARAEMSRGKPKAEAIRVVKTFVAPVHDFLAHYGIKNRSEVPSEHAIVFDEAQRAWNEQKMRSKKRGELSEPRLLLQIMERLPDWCTVIALVGGGQEIHSGEGGLEEWGAALNSRPVPWRVIVSPDLLQGGASVAGHRLFATAPASNLDVVECSALHLAVSVRCPREKMLGQWVDGVLRNAPVAAELGGREFPIVLTRDLSLAREWLRSHSDASDRAGLLASSGALRLRADGIEVSSGFRVGYPYAEWFLAGAEDTRSSKLLEVAASEFECQGLELDWTCVCWGGDFTIDPGTGKWGYLKFSGKGWQNVRKAENRVYIANKYRVLLTRARKGMVIWIPEGDSNDATRDSGALNATAKYLSECGIEWLSRPGSRPPARCGSEENSSCD